MSFSCIPLRSVCALQGMWACLFPFDALKQARVSAAQDFFVAWLKSVNVSVLFYVEISKLLFTCIFYCFLFKALKVLHTLFINFQSFAKLGTTNTWSGLAEERDWCPL